MSTALRHPVLWIFLSLVALTGLWLGIGAPVALITQIAIYVLYGAGVNLLVGYTGLVPFGASVFFGTASYAVAIGLKNFLGNEIEALIFAIAFSVVLGAAIAMIILRRRGLYFSLLTLAFSQIAFEIAFKWTALTGGENGMQDVPRPIFKTDLGFHAFVVVTVCLVMWAMWRLVHAPFGRALQAMRDNDLRMRSLGYNTFKLKFSAFVIMGAIIGYGGGLLALMLRGAYADNLSWQHAGDALLMVVLGGVHQFLGPLAGAVAFTLLQDQLSSLLEAWWLIFAPIIIIFALLSPEGIVGLVQRVLRIPGWTLVRSTIPPRPAMIPPLARGAIEADPSRPVLALRGLSKRFGNLVTANDIALDVYPFRLHSVIGPNGAGKTTLFNMLSGALAPNAGSIVFEGRDITRTSMHRRAQLGIGRSFQILSVFPELTVFENVRIAVQAKDVSGFARRWRAFITDAHGNDAMNLRVWSLLQAVGLEDNAAALCKNLPHGAKRLLEIAITLATDARLLLLDEPLAGLAEADRIVVGGLIRKLADTHAVLLIEHDIDRVLKLSDRITVLHQGRLIADGAPAEVAADPEVISAYLGAAGKGGSGGYAAPAALPADAKDLLKVEGLAVGYGGSTVLTGLDFTVREGEAVALLGRNGVGKTTLLRAITGTLRPHAGRVSFDGREITRLPSYEINRAGIALVPEGRRLFPNLTVVENLRLAARPGGISIEEVFALFPRLRERQRAKAENLSGGERQMVAIARALVVPSRLILLDEPFEGLAPAIVKEVMEALVRLRGKVAMVIVEHHAETVLPIANHAYALVNGQVAYEGSARRLEEDHALQARLLGVVQVEEVAA
ncbi:MAG TPA: branched-chain amino acid ABC transporter ATP-binding protein/permease [Acetobacteraceae bacterium]|nr:branched-chain amino acid ABC transporter ATP-binding protein/permease [Acetobacteraceae bacterium]